MATKAVSEIALEIAIQKTLGGSCPLHCFAFPEVEIRKICDCDSCSDGKYPTWEGRANCWKKMFIAEAEQRLEKEK